MKNSTATQNDGKAVRSESTMPAKPAEKDRAAPEVGSSTRQQVKKICKFFGTARGCHKVDCQFLHTPGKVPNGKAHKPTIPVIELDVYIQDDALEKLQEAVPEFLVKNGPKSHTNPHPIARAERAVVSCVLPSGTFVLEIQGKRRKTDVDARNICRLPLSDDDQDGCCPHNCEHLKKVWTGGYHTVTSLDVPLTPNDVQAVFGPSVQHLFMAVIIHDSCLSEVGDQTATWVPGEPDSFEKTGSVGRFVINCDGLTSRIENDHAWLQMQLSHSGFRAELSRTIGAHKIYRITRSHDGPSTPIIVPDPLSYITRRTAKMFVQSSSDSRKLMVRVSDSLIILRDDYGWFATDGTILRQLYSRLVARGQCENLITSAIVQTAKVSADNVCVDRAARWVSEVNDDNQWNQQFALELPAPTRYDDVLKYVPFAHLFQPTRRDSTSRLALVRKGLERPNTLRRDAARFGVFSVLVSCLYGLVVQGFGKWMMYMVVLLCLSGQAYALDEPHFVVDPEATWMSHVASVMITIPGGLIAMCEILPDIVAFPAPLPKFIGYAVLVAGYGAMIPHVPLGASGTILVSPVTLVCTQFTALMVVTWSIHTMLTAQPLPLFLWLLLLKLLPHVDANEGADAVLVQYRHDRFLPVHYEGPLPADFGLPGYVSQRELKPMADGAKITIGTESRIVDLDNPRDTCFAVGVCFAGYLPSVTLTCQHNLIVAARNRQLAAMPDYCVELFKRLSDEYVAQLEWRQDVAEPDFDKWNSRFPKGRQISHLNALMAYLEGWYDDSTATARNAFVKIEKILRIGKGEFDPRVITGATDIYNVVWGSYYQTAKESIKAFYNQWDQNVLLASGCTSSQLGRWLENALCFGGRAICGDDQLIVAGNYLVEVDGARHDAHMHKGFFDLKWDIYDKLIGDIPEKAREWAQKAAVHTRAMSRSLGVTWEHDYRVRSGDPDTTDGNSVVTDFISWYVQNLVIHGQGLGNTVEEMTRDVTESVLKLGYEITLKITPNVWDSTFLSGSFMPVNGTYYWYPLPGRQLSKIGWSLRKGNVALQDWAGVLLSYKHYRFVPFLREYIDYAIGLLPDGMVEKAHARFHQIIPGDNPTCPADDTWYWFECRYGLGPEDAEEFKMLLQSVTSIPFMVDSPAISRMVEIDME